MKKKRKIAILTGKRGGFGAMIKLMRLIDSDEDLALDLIVTDMHLSSFFGNTIEEVKKFFDISYKLELGQKNDSGEERSRALGKVLIKMTNILSELNPDILLVLGDRGEVLSGCIAAMELNIPIAHILGGDVAGNRDGNRIHAITKIANLHFPSSKDAYDRIIKLGEEPRRIYNFGATYIDYIVENKFTPNKEARAKYNIKEGEKYFICIQHPITLREKESYSEMYELLSALKEKKIRTIIIYPCSDQGYMETIRAINEFKDVPFFDVYKNIEAMDFWGLMAEASLLIGNSSSGLIEAPYFNLPSVTLGKRQDGRIRDNNVIECVPEKKSILKAIDQALSDEFRSKIKNHYIFGDGKASEKIYDVLKNVTIDDDLLTKKITY